MPPPRGRLAPHHPCSSLSDCDLPAFTTTTMGSIQPSNDIPEVDVLLVGAGFGSYTVLNRLRKLGLNCKVYEKGSKSGGIWYWNCYVSLRLSLLCFRRLTWLAGSSCRLCYPYLSDLRQGTLGRLHLYRAVSGSEGASQVLRLC